MYAPLTHPRVQLTMLDAAGAAVEVEDAEAAAAGGAAHRHARVAAPSLVRSVRVNVSCSAPAAWLFVETETAGYWDANALHLLPDAPLTLLFTGYDAFDAAEMQRSLTARSLWDLTHRT